MLSHSELIHFPADFATPDDCGAPRLLRDLASSAQPCQVITPSGRMVWLAADHDTVTSVLVDPRFTRAALGERHTLVAADITCQRHSLLSVPPERHRALRSTLTPALTARHSAAFLTGFKRECRKRASRCAGVGGADVSSMYVTPVSAAFSADVLGVPAETLAPLSAVARIHSDPAASADGVREATAQLVARSQNLLTEPDQHAVRPGSTIGTLVVAHRRGEISLAEARDTVALLVVMSTDAVTAPLLKAIGAALGNPTLRQQAKAANTWRHVALEACRFTNNALTEFPRVALERVALAGHSIGAGEVVLTSALGASWDPAAVHRPSCFIPGRPEGASLAFGRGPRACLARGAVVSGIATALHIFLEGYEGSEEAAGGITTSAALQVGGRGLA